MRGAWVDLDPRVHPPNRHRLLMLLVRHGGSARWSDIEDELGNPSRAISAFMAEGFVISATRRARGGARLHTVVRLTDRGRAALLAWAETVGRVADEVVEAGGDADA